MYIKLYLSKQEKKRLEDIATAKKVSVSKLCYEKVLPLLSGSFLSVNNFEGGTDGSNDETIMRKEIKKALEKQLVGKDGDSNDRHM